MSDPNKRYTATILSEIDDYESRLKQTLESLGRLARQVQYANGLNGKIDASWLLPKIRSIRETGVMEVMKHV